MPVAKLSLAEKVRRASARGLRPGEIAKRYRISSPRVSRILWEARNRAKRQAWETEWKRKQYGNNPKHRAARLLAARRARERAETRVT